MTGFRGHSSLRAINTNWISSIESTISKLTTNDCRLQLSPRFSNSLHKSLNKKHSAVLIPLCNKKQVPSILFTVRSNNVGTHKGHVSFPGGHCNFSEDAIDTALRETNEEIGYITIDKVKILGVCQTIPAITGVLVTPVLGFICDDVNDLEMFHPNEVEVAKIFTRPISLLTNANYRKIETLTRQNETFDMAYFGDKQDDECIWGLTGLILDGVLNNLIKPSLN